MSQRSEPQNDILVVASLVQRVVATANLQNQGQSTAKPSCVLSLLQISGWCTGLDICMDICTNMCMDACVDACMWTCADFKQRAGGLVVGQVHLNRNVRINNKINSRHNDGRNHFLLQAEGWLRTTKGTPGYGGRGKASRSPSASCSRICGRGTCRIGARSF